MEIPVISLRHGVFIRSSHADGLVWNSLPTGREDKRSPTQNNPTVPVTLPMGVVKISLPSHNFDHHHDGVSRMATSPISVVSSEHSPLKELGCLTHLRYRLTRSLFIPLHERSSDAPAGGEVSPIRKVRRAPIRVWPRIMVSQQVLGLER